MKRVILAVLAVFPLLAQAAEVTFAWDYVNPPADLQYELFVVPSDAEDWGTTPIVTSEPIKLVTGLDENLQYKASVRARQGDLVSGFSNIVVFRPGNDPLIIIIPDRPSGLRVER